MHEIKLYNSLGNELQVFKPIKEGEVSIYVCGPTVYSSPHIGNFRPVIVFDVLRRLFLFLGYKVTFVSNYTDVDDKIIKRAKELNISEKELTQSVISEFASLVDQVGSLQPDYKPTPTGYMDQIISYIDDLVKNGSAYAVDGDVYFRISSILGYGELSGNTPESLISGSRIEVSSKKESPLDFALWKKTDEGIKWASPWGEGRPGWHTECCVMINSIFKEQDGLIDIHGGGYDLKFPHHENEMAQAKAHNHNKLAHYWLHNGFINLGDEKMSKSLGNVYLAKDIFAKYGGNAFRLMVLSSHYRAPVSFSEDTITEAVTQINRLSQAYKQLAIRLQLNGGLKDAHGSHETEFLDAMCEDLNTPNALSIMYGELKKANLLLRNPNSSLEEIADCFNTLKDYFFILGLRIEYPTLEAEDVSLFLQYNEAKAKKDFAKSDEIRSTLIKKGLL